ncbi:hypothetical protein BGX31_011296 [Mortierella sp. GBA43]|nr:hypothetical protein BGX31_011296 [Mortierella sp. GBA43]
MNNNGRWIGTTLRISGDIVTITAPGTPLRRFLTVIEFEVVRRSRLYRNLPRVEAVFGAGPDTEQTTIEFPVIKLKAKGRAKAPDGPKNKVRFVADPDPVDVAAAVDAIADVPDTDAPDADAADAADATPAAVDVLADADAKAAHVADAVDAADAIAIDIADDFDAFDPFSATDIVDTLTSCSATLCGASLVWEDHN